MATVAHRTGTSARSAGRRWLSLLLALALVVSNLVLFAATPALAAPNEAIVNSVADVVDATPGDDICDTGNLVGPDPECTLRAAIQESNASALVDTVIVPAGTYTLALVGADDIAASGDLDILAPVTVTGAGAATTIIQAGTTTLNGIDRVLEVLGGGALDI